MKTNVEKAWLIIQALELNPEEMYALIGKIQNAQRKICPLPFAIIYDDKFGNEKTSLLDFQRIHSIAAVDLDGFEVCCRKATYSETEKKFIRKRQDKLRQMFQTLKSYGVEVCSVDEILA